MAGRFSVEAVFKAIDQVSAPVRRIQESVGRLTNRMEKGLRSVTGVTNSMVGGLKSTGSFLLKVGAVGVGAVTAGVTLLTREFSKIEDAEAAFTPLMGGAERARQLVDALNQAAAATPFQFETLSAATSQLLPVMNGDIEKTIATLKKLGDTAGGNAEKLDSITRGFTKAMLKGKVDMESLNMIAEAGVPIFDDLAAVMGKKVNASFFKMLSAGKVSTKQLEAAFTRLTSKGGKFYQGMEIASRTTSGLWSTLMDNISLTAAELGGVLSPIVKELIGSATDVAQQVREWVKANRELISSKIIEYVDKIKAGVLSFIDYIQRLNAEHSILDRIAEGFASIANGIDWLMQHGEQILTLTKWVLGLIVALNVLTTVLTVVNLLMTLNPIGLIVVGIIAAIAAVTALVVWVDELVSMFEAAPTWVKMLLAPFIAILNVIKLIKDHWGDIVSGGKKIAAFFGFDVATTEAPKTAAAVPVAPEPPTSTVPRGVSWGAPPDYLSTLSLAASPHINVAPPPVAINTAPPVVNVTTPAATAAPPIVSVAPSVPPSSPVVNVATPAAMAAPSPRTPAPSTPPVVNVATPAATPVSPVVNVAPSVIPNWPPLANTAQPSQPDGQPATQPGPQVVTPQERVARSIEERRTTSSAEVTIKDSTGRAEVTKGALSNNIKLKSSGAF